VRPAGAVDYNALVQSIDLLGDTAEAGQQGNATAQSALLLQQQNDAIALEAARVAARQETIAAQNASAATPPPAAPSTFSLSVWWAGLSTAGKAGAVIGAVAAIGVPVYFYGKSHKKR
jgi:hypothetical protein